MTWKPEKAKEWILKTARDLMSDAMGMPYSDDDQSGEPIRASAGALFYMLDQNQFFQTEGEFRKYMEEHMQAIVNILNGLWDKYAVPMSVLVHMHSDAERQLAESMHQLYPSR